MNPLPKARVPPLAPLALTAYAKAADRVRALAGAIKHLSKPVEAAEFVLVVANLAGRVQSS